MDCMWARRTGLAVGLAAVSAAAGRTGSAHVARQVPAADVATAVTARDCGSYTSVNGPAPGGVTDQGWSCFAEALLNHRVAVLHLTETTTEGDPVYMTFTARPDGRAEVVTDSSQDRFAGTGKGLGKQTCSSPDPRPSAKKMLLFKVCATTP